MPEALKSPLRLEHSQQKGRLGERTITAMVKGFLGASENHSLTPTLTTPYLLHSVTRGFHCIIFRIFVSIYLILFSTLTEH